MSGIIPKENAGSFKRWQIGAFDQPGHPRPAAATPEAAAPAPAAESPDTGVAVAFELPTAEAVERIHEEARASGYQVGYDAGHAEGLQAAAESARQAAADEATRLLAMADNLQRSLAELDQRVAEQLLALATEIAAQVIRGTLKVRDDVLLPVIREAVAALPVHHAHVVLRLNPTDAGRIRELLGDQLAQSGTQIHEDTEVSPGGCLVRAGTSEVDASIETRWKRVLEAIGTTPDTWTPR